MDSLLTPTNVLKIWGKSPAADKAHAAREREAHVARVRAEIDAGTYDADGQKYDAAFARMVNTAGAEAVEAERAEWDRKNTADRFE